MSIEWQNTPTQWQNTGVEPSDTLKTNGYNGGDRPAADTFNHIFNNNYKCISEIQTQIENLLSGSESIPDCTDGNIYTYMESLLNGEIGSFEARDFCEGLPLGSLEHLKLVILYNEGSTNETHNMFAIGINENNDLYVCVLFNGVWQKLRRIYRVGDSLNASTLGGYSADSFAQNNKRFSAARGYNGGYTFTGGVAEMLLSENDEFQLYINNSKLLYSYNARLVFPNGTVYVQELQPTAPDGSLWAW